MKKEYTIMKYEMLSRIYFWKTIAKYEIDIQAIVDDYLIWKTKEFLYKNNIPSMICEEHPILKNVTKDYGKYSSFKFKKYIEWEIQSYVNYLSHY